MRLLICGDRNWNNISLIRAWVETHLPIDVVIHGNARGADRLGAQVALELGIKVISFPAKWNEYGRAAGPIRNQQMLDEGNPDFIIAFHNDIRNSKGTKDMITRAQNHAIDYVVVSE